MPNQLCNRLYDSRAFFPVCRCALAFSRFSALRKDAPAGRV